MIAVAIGFLSGGLRVEVNDESVKVKWGGLRFRILRIPLDSIASVVVDSFRPMRDFGGWGIKGGWTKNWKGVAGFFMSGTRGVLIQTKKGKKYLLGSDTPDRLAAVIRSRIVPEISNHFLNERDGEQFVAEESEEEKAVNAKKEAKQEKIGLWIMGFAAFGMLAVMFSIPGLLLLGETEPTVKILDSGIKISGLYGVKIDFTEITDISLMENTISSIGLTRRTNGYGTGRTQKGYFQSNKHGKVLLFTKTNSSPTIHIQRKGKADVFLNLSNNEATRTLYNKLKTAFVAH
jgi:hypothetical protein